MRGTIVILAVLGIFIFGCIQQCGNEVNQVCGEDNVTYQNPCLAMQAGVQTAYGGPCGRDQTLATCYDSDNGKNLLEQGTTQMRGAGASATTYTDSCIGTSGVQEYYCENNQIKPESMTCPEGTICESGTCTDIVCSDTDGGYNNYVKGTVAKGSETHTDSCNGTSNVVEYACGTSNQITSASMRCGSGEACSDGACVMAPTVCTDTDGGNYVYEKGTTTSDAGTYIDYCLDTSTVKEYYCSGTTIIDASLYCGSSYVCSNGACVTAVCTDSDGGRDENEFGTTTRGAYSERDTCYDSDTVNEYYCNGDLMAGIKIDCDSDEVCSDGVCVHAACSETDDANDPTEFGRLSIGTTTREDSCTNLTQLKEYYCTSGGSDYTYANINCFTYFGGSMRGVCWEDICIQTYCQDSDSGQNEHSAGSSRMYTTNGYDTGWNNDICQDSTHLTEWYCDGNWLKNTSMTCELDEYCSGGRCVEATCVDSDGGISYIVAGSVTKGGVYKEDGCLDSNTLREWYCSGNNPDSIDATCPVGCNSAQRRCNPL